MSSDGEKGGVPLPRWLKTFVRRLTPPVVFDPLARILRPPPPPPPPPEAPRENVFSGNYASWEEALQDSKGYSAPHILSKAREAALAVKRGEAAYERDTVLFRRPEISHALVASLHYVASLEQGSLSILDFGGALGSSYVQNHAFLRHLPSLRWSVVEQQNFVECGQHEFQDDVLRFYPSLRDCLAVEKPNFVLLSGVLQYLPKPYEFLEDLFRAAIPFVLVDRTPATRFDRERIVIQQVPAWIYEASYPMWLLNQALLDNAFDRGGYEVIDEFTAHAGTIVRVDGLEAPYRGWFLRARD